MKLRRARSFALARDHVRDTAGELAAARFYATLDEARACFWRATHAPSFDLARDGRLVALTARHGRRAYR